MSLTLAYQGQEISKSNQQSYYKQTYQGFENQVNTKISELTLGVFHQDKGYLTQWRKSQKQGPIWQVEIEYKITYTSNSGNQSQTEVGKYSSTLSSRNLQLPLEKLQGYRTKWNYYLAGLGGVSTPAWWDTATDFFIMPVTDRKYYKWCRSVGEIPLDPDPQTGLYWQILQKPTKPGIEYFDYAYFCITEKRKYNTPTAAGNAINKNINKLVGPHEDFGLGDADWKFDDASVSWDGNYWIASMTFTQSPTSWDSDLYGPNAQLKP